MMSMRRPNNELPGTLVVDPVPEVFDPTDVSDWQHFKCYIAEFYYDTTSRIGCIWANHSIAIVVSALLAIYGTIMIILIITNLPPAVQESVKESVSKVMELIPGIDNSPPEPPPPTRTVFTTGDMIYDPAYTEPVLTSSVQGDTTYFLTIAPYPSKTSEPEPTNRYPFDYAYCYQCEQVHDMPDMLPREWPRGGGQVGTVKWFVLNNVVVENVPGPGPDM